jgi:hypothetical protein
MTSKSLRYVLHKTKPGKKKASAHENKKVTQLPSFFSDFVAAYLNPSLVFVLAEKIIRHKKN